MTARSDRDPIDDAALMALNSPCGRTVVDNQRSHAVNFELMYIPLQQRLREAMLENLELKQYLREVKEGKKHGNSDD